MECRSPDKTCPKQQPGRAINYVDRFCAPDFDKHERLKPIFFYSTH